MSLFLNHITSSFLHLTRDNVGFWWPVEILWEKGTNTNTNTWERWKWDKPHGATRAGPCCRAPGTDTQIFLEETMRSAQMFMEKVTQIFLGEKRTNIRLKNWGRVWWTKSAQKSTQKNAQKSAQMKKCSKKYSKKRSKKCSNEKSAQMKKCLKKYSKKC